MPFGPSRLWIGGRYSPDLGFRRDLKAVQLVLCAMWAMPNRNLYCPSATRRGALIAVLILLDKKAI